MIIAIDGPAASGKSSVAKALAQRLALAFLNTGAMYRAAGLACLAAGIDLDDALACDAFVAKLDLSLDHEGRILLRGEAIDTGGEVAGAAASRVAVHPGVRRRLVALQQEFGRIEGCVAEGRDTATVVFKDADLLVYLNASARVRAERRAKELGRPEEVLRLEQEIAARDQRDRTRSLAPLRPAEGALVIESDGLTVEAIVGQIVAALYEKRP